MSQVQEIEHKPQQPEGERPIGARHRVIKAHIAATIFTLAEAVGLKEFPHFFLLQMANTRTNLQPKYSEKSSVLKKQYKEISDHSFEVVKQLRLSEGQLKFISEGMAKLHAESFEGNFLQEEPGHEEPVAKAEPAKAEPAAQTATADLDLNLDDLFKDLDNEEPIVRNPLPDLLDTSVLEYANQYAESNGANSFYAKSCPKDNGLLVIGTSIGITKGKEFKVNVDVKCDTKWFSIKEVPEDYVVFSNGKHLTGKHDHTDGRTYFTRLIKLVEGRVYEVREVHDNGTEPGKPWVTVKVVRITCERNAEGIVVPRRQRVK